VDAQYECASDTHVPQGAVSVEVPLVATRSGKFANRPLIVGTTPTELTIVDEIVDRAAWSVESYEMAGGSDGVVDDDLQRYASAFASGRHGPNDRAALAGVLKGGAKRSIAFDDPSLAALVVFVADQSWASSMRWTRLLRQFLAENKFIGFGLQGARRQRGERDHCRRGDVQGSPPRVPLRDHVD
jgi:hypothetical protein